MRQIEVHLSFSSCLFRLSTLTILFSTLTNSPPVAYFGSYFARNARTHERRAKRKGKDSFLIDSTKSLIYRDTSGGTINLRKRRDLTRTAFSSVHARTKRLDSFAAMYVHCNHAHTSISVLTRFLFGRFSRSLTSESRMILVNRRRVRSSLTEISS